MKSVKGTLRRCSALACGLLMTAVAADGVLAKSAVKGVPHSAFRQVEIEGLESKGLFSSGPLKLIGYLLEPGTGGKAPAAVMAPACGGVLTQNQKFIRPWYRQMAFQLKQMGVAVLIVDGFNPRGHKEVCTQEGQFRSVDAGTRMKDSLAGLRYLRNQPTIDGDRIFLFAWGAAGGFEAMSRGTPEVEAIAGGFKAAVLLYPRCEGVESAYDAYAPIRVFIGAEDRWNPPGPCLTLTKTKHGGSAPVEVTVYAGAVHGFDHPEPPKKAEKVNDTIGAVLVGGNPQAREDAYRQIAAFLFGFLPQQTNTAAATPKRRKKGKAAAAAAFLSAEEIRQTIVGNTLRFVAPSNNRELSIYYEQDGRVLMNAPSGGKVLTKKWYITQKDMLCRTYGRDNKEQCVRVSPPGGAGKLKLVNDKTGLNIDAILLEGRQLPH